MNHNFYEGLAKIDGEIKYTEKELQRMKFQLFKYTTLEPTPAYSSELADVVKRLSMNLAQLVRDREWAECWIRTDAEDVTRRNEETKCTTANNVMSKCTTVNNIVPVDKNPNIESMTKSEKARQARKTVAMKVSKAFKNRKK